MDENNVPDLIFQLVFNTINPSLLLYHVLWHPQQTATCSKYVSTNHTAHINRQYRSCWHLCHFIGCHQNIMSHSSLPFDFKIIDTQLHSPLCSLVNFSKPNSALVRLLSGYPTLTRLKSSQVLAHFSK